MQLTAFFNSLKNLNDGEIPVGDQNKKQLSYLNRVSKICLIELLFQMIEQLTKIDKCISKLFHLILSKQSNELQLTLNFFSAALCQLLDYMVSCVGF